MELNLESPLSHSLSHWPSRLEYDGVNGTLLAFPSYLQVWSMPYAGPEPAVIFGYNIQVGEVGICWGGLGLTLPLLFSTAGGDGSDAEGRHEIQDTLCELRGGNFGAIGSEYTAMLLCVYDVHTGVTAAFAGLDGPSRCWWL